VFACAAGCHHEPVVSTGLPIASNGDPIAAALDRAGTTGREVAVLIVDPARSAADRSASAAFPAGLPPVEPVVLDLGKSQNRALAAPFHPSTTQPTLVCLTPAGIIVTHVDADDPVPVAASGRGNVGEELKGGPDYAYQTLRDNVDARPWDVGLRMALADFLLDHQNDREAIPHLKFVADDAAADLPTRVRAWVSLGRAHLWVGEPEKARYSAQALIDTLGLQAPEAVAGGNLVRGLQDTKAKRFDRAHDELAAAVAAAPASPYGREAAELLAKLPRGN
jgi:hypothetical protein